jgi:hypothetical protein
MPFDGMARPALCRTSTSRCLSFPAELEDFAVRWHYEEREAVVQYA